MSIDSPQTFPPETPPPQTPPPKSPPPTTAAYSPRSGASDGIGSFRRVIVLMRLMGRRWIAVAMILAIGVTVSCVTLRILFDVSATPPANHSHSVSSVIQAAAIFGLMIGSIAAWVLAIVMGDLSCDGAMAGRLWFRRHPITTAEISIATLAIKLSWVVAIYGLVWSTLTDLPTPTPSEQLPFWMPLLLAAATATACQAATMRRFPHAAIDYTAAALFLIAMMLMVVGIFATHEGDVRLGGSRWGDPTIAAGLAALAFVTSVIWLIYEIAIGRRDEPRMGRIVDRLSRGVMVPGRNAAPAGTNARSHRGDVCDTRNRDDAIVDNENRDGPIATDRSLTPDARPSSGDLGFGPSPHPVRGLVGYEWRRFRGGLIFALAITVPSMVAISAFDHPIGFWFVVAAMVQLSAASMVCAANRTTPFGRTAQGWSGGISGASGAPIMPMLVRVMPTSAGTYGYVRLAVQCALTAGMLALLCIPMTVWWFRDTTYQQVASEVAAVGGYAMFLAIWVAIAAVMLTRVAMWAIVDLSGRPAVTVSIVIAEGLIAAALIGKVLSIIFAMQRSDRWSVEAAAATWESWQPIIIATLWSIVAAKLVVASVVAVIGFRRGLHTARSIAGVVGLWTFVVVGLALLTVRLTSVPLIPTMLWLAVVIVLPPLARLMSVPAFVAMDRHR